jgi:transcriptional regulator with GAF, ATPase, and Fis domain
MAITEENVSEILSRTGPRLVSARAPRSGSTAEDDWRVEYLNKKLVGNSSCMITLKKTIICAANCNSTVLVTGESGTGKELIARAIHDLQTRRGEPFLAINCGALTESLLESELFGHVKGAFTGAAVYKKGVFEAASQGTIFLDEFGEMSAAMQVRLLRVLQERRVRPVGATDAKEIAFSSRIIVATNRNLEREVAEGRFRQDLYYRVNVLQIRSPPLRERIEDLPLLANMFLKRLSEADSRPEHRLDVSALERLHGYEWPGNVRELENVIERMALLELNGLATSAHLPELKLPGQREQEIVSGRFADTVEGVPSIRDSKRQELESYLRQVQQVGGNLAEAARRLKLKRTTLHMRIKRLQERCER